MLERRSEVLPRTLGVFGADGLVLGHVLLSELENIKVLSRGLKEI